MSSNTIVSTRFGRWVSLAACLAALPPAHAAAQQSADPAEEARLHLGPLALTPRFSVRNLGIDSNVFNAADSPTRDFTGTFGPGVDTWLRFGRARLSGQTVIEWTYFRKADGQRSLNTTQLGRLEIDLATVTPYISGGVVRTRQRPNMEIDERVRQQRLTTGVGTRVQLGGRSRSTSIFAARNSNSVTTGSAAMRSRRRSTAPPRRARWCSGWTSPRSRPLPCERRSHAMSSNSHACATAAA